MRHQHLKLRKPHSTKAERRFAELCKDLHIPFKTKVNIAGHEVDFLIKRLALEINGHPQSVQKNKDILAAGYTPFHLQNNQVTPSLKEWIRKL